MYKHTYIHIPRQIPNSAKPPCLLEPLQIRETNPLINRIRDVKTNTILQNYLKYKAPLYFRLQASPLRHFLAHEGSLLALPASDCSSISSHHSAFHALSPLFLTVPRMKDQSSCQESVLLQSTIEGISRKINNNYRFKICIRFESF